MATKTQGIERGLHPLDGRRRRKALRDPAKTKKKRDLEPNWV